MTIFDMAWWDIVENGVMLQFYVACEKDHF